jgi:hypothetical protein
MEICHFLLDSSIEKSQLELLAAARQAQVRTFGRPIGPVVDNREDARPRATNEGIVANVSRESRFWPGRVFDYWTLKRNGDFFSLASLTEDNHGSRQVIDLDARIVCTARALRHCVSLYRGLGIDFNANVEIGIRHGGLRGRELASGRPLHPEPGGENTLEDEVSASATVRLGAIESLMLETVKKLCEPLFVVFDFASVPDDVYRQIVTDFLNGKIS